MYDELNGSVTLGGGIIYLFSLPSGLAPLDHLARKANQLLLTDHVDALIIFLS